jgi:integrase
MPEGLPYPAADWWRGLIVAGYMTGWRISDLLGLRREDLDLEGGYAVTRFEDNKGKRDDRRPLTRRSWVR